MAGSACVVDRVLGVAMTEIVLDQPEVVAPVGQEKATGMAQHMRMGSR